MTLANEVKGLSKKAKGVGAGAIVTALTSIGFAAQEYATVEILTNTNTQLTVEYQKLNDQIQDFVIACNKQVNDRNDKLIKCYEQCAEK